MSGLFSLTMKPSAAFKKLERNMEAGLDVEKLAVLWAAELGPILQQALYDEAPVSEEDEWYDGHTHMRDTITYSIDANRIEWTAEPPYTDFILSGTGPHPIDPVNADVLHWHETGTGDDVFAMHVDHPGTAPNPFNVRAWDRERAAAMGLAAALTRAELTGIESGVPFVP